MLPKKFTKNNKMGNFTLWFLAVSCICGQLAVGLPLRISPDEFQHLEQEENHSKSQKLRPTNEERIGTTEMSVEENVRRMQGNRNR